MQKIFQDMEKGWARLTAPFYHFYHFVRKNTKTGSRKNILAHYDLGNDFYGLWLDETMTYSSALFKTGQESLEKAQIQKYGSMVDEMGVQPGDHVLEIGPGLGTLTRALAAREGIFCGISSGGAVAAALKLDAEVEKAVIVAIICDRGDRYLSTGVFPD